MSASRKRDIFALVIGLAVVLVDQLTKAWIVQYFGYEGGRAPIPILGEILTLYYVQNTGVAFSLFAGQNIKFALIFVALALVSYLYWRFRESPSLWLRLGFALVLGGAVGNLVDRFTRGGSVVDFIHFQIPNVFNFAVFNVADSGITVGVILIAIVLYQVSSVSPGEPSSSPTGRPANDKPTTGASQAGVRGGERS
jgi:signal peptidase II